MCICATECDDKAKCSLNWFNFKLRTKAKGKKLINCTRARMNSFCVLISFNASFEKDNKLRYRSTIEYRKKKKNLQLPHTNFFIFFNFFFVKGFWHTKIDVPFFVDRLLVSSHPEEVSWIEDVFFETRQPLLFWGFAPHVHSIVVAPDASIRRTAFRWSTRI